MRTKPTITGMKLSFLFLTFMLYCNCLIINGQDEYVVSKIEYELDGIIKSIITDSRQNSPENTESVSMDKEEGKKKLSDPNSLKNLTECDNSWQGGSNPAFSFFLINDSLVNSFKIMDTISSGGCSTSTTLTYSSKSIVNRTISINYTNRYYNGFAWVTDIEVIDGTFSEDMNSISGTYSITSGGCGATISGNWSALPATPRPSQPSVITGNSAVCSGVAEPYSITNQSGITYNWSAPGGTVAGSGNSISVTWNSTGAQTLTVTPSNDCGSGTARTLDVTVNSTPLQPSEVTGNSTICSGVAESYSVTDVSGVTYNWSASGGTVTGSGNSVSVTWNTAGAQTLTVTPSNDCGSGTGRTLDVTVNSVPLQPSEITGNSTVYTDVAESYSITNESGVTYNWSASGGTVTGNGNSVSVTWNAAGAQTLTVTPSNDCGSGADRTLDVTVYNPTGMEEIWDNSGFLIYPNPTYGKITIESAIPCYSVKIYSLEGKALVNKVLNKKVSEIDISSLTNGIYLIKLENSNSVITKKLLKQ
jgi:hypothetical protein